MHAYLIPHSGITVCSGDLHELMVRCKTSVNGFIVKRVEDILEHFAPRVN